MVTKATRDVVDLSIRPVLSVDIRGGNINATAIGVTNPDVGFFTNLQCQNLTVTSGLNISGATVTGTLYSNYADLAEYYKADSIYIPGTLVCLGGTAEITASKKIGEFVYGVISTNPAYVMNAGQNSDHDLPVALVGRVPCRVIGPIRKFQRLMASEIPGVAEAYDAFRLPIYPPKEASFFAKALQDNDEPGEKLVEVALLLGR